MTDAVVCDRVSKSYGRSAPLGVKELLVGRHRRTRGRFARDWALKDVSLSVPEGGAFGIVGANGSGKSTLLSLLLGVLRADSGDIRVRGRVGALLALGAGFHPELTGRQNIFLYGSILGMRRQEVRRQFDRIVEFSELEEALDNPLRTYSSGMITRLGFSTIIHAGADVLLIDEVLAVGDRSFQDKCRRHFDSIRGRVAIVIVSHDLDAMRELCPHGLWLKEGEVGAYGPIGGVVDAYIRDQPES